MNAKKLVFAFHSFHASHVYQLNKKKVFGESVFMESIMDLWPEYYAMGWESRFVSSWSDYTSIQL